ncbi:MAG: ribonuclease P protein component [Coriobacteriia bacterium]|nr:ribonuclease P protein component [Coriobacteriia bacterium]
MPAVRGTLTRKSDIERLFALGVAGRSHFLTVVARPVGTADDPEGRVMVVAGRGIGSAVRRNRAKRVLREVVRRASGPWPGYHVAVIARPPALAARPEDLDAALNAALKKAGVER